MKKILSTLIAALLLTGLFTGCESSQSSAQGPGAAGSRTTVTTAITSDPGTFDPNFASKETERVFIRSMYEPLYYINADNDSEWIPALAVSYEVSSDGLTYTFHLREGVKFHNGEDFTADDVLFTYKNSFDSPYRAANFVGIVKEGMKVVDDYTFEVNLEVPNAAVLANLAGVEIVPGDYYAEVGEDGFNAAPIGTGSHKFESYVTGTRITLAGFDDYWGGAPEIKTVVIRIIGDENTIAIALENGEIDLYAGLNTALHRTVSQNPNIIIEERAHSRLGYIFINTERAPWDNVKLRQAVGYAMDRKYIIDAALSGFGMEWGSLNLPNVIDAPNNTLGFTYDLEKAKSLIAESGLTTPIDGGTILCPGEPHRTVGTIIQQMLAEIGVEISVISPEGNTFVSDGQSGNIFIGTVSTPLTGHISYHSVMYNSNSIGSFNFARYNNPEVDALFEKGLTGNTVEERKEIYRQLFDIAIEDAPCIPLYIGITLMAYDKDLTVPIMNGNHVHFKNVHWN